MGLISHALRGPRIGLNSPQISEIYLTARIVYTSHTMRLMPEDIQLIGNEVAFKWNDGGETFLPLEMLRRACPCAGCGGEPDVLGRVVRPTVTYTAQSFGLKSFQVIGGYAFQPVWQDGHSSGLYTFDFLRKLAA